MDPMKFSKRDGISTRVYKRVKGYMKKRKNYVRLGGNVHDESGIRRRRFWQVRITRKLKLKLRFKFKLNTPKKLLIKIRDGYINMMMRMANSQAIAGTYGYGSGIAKFETTPIKEYDEKMVIEIYKILAMRQQAQLQAQAQAHGIIDGVSRIDVSR